MIKVSRFDSVCTTLHRLQNSKNAVPGKSAHDTKRKQKKKREVKNYKKKERNRNGGKREKRL